MSGFDLHNIPPSFSDAAARGDIASMKDILSCKRYVGGAWFVSEARKALFRAAKNGHAECVKILIDITDPKADGSMPLRAASFHGHLECVKILLPVSDPTEDHFDALYGAACNGHVECTRTILSAISPEDAILTFRDTYGFESVIAFIESLMQADAIKEKLEQESLLRHDTAKSKATL